jgi:hypothetical protein
VVAAEGAADGAADGGERGGRRGGGGIGGRHCPALSSPLVPRVCLLASLGGDWLPLALLCSLSLSLSLSLLSWLLLRTSSRQADGWAAAAGWRLCSTPADGME